MGKITGVKGIKGLLKVKSYTQNPCDIAAYGPLTTHDGAQCFHMKVVDATPQTVVVACQGITDRTQAEKWKGTDLFVSREVLPTLEPEEFYHVDLLALPVQDEAQEKLGTVKAVQNFGAGDFLEILSPEGIELTVPFTREAVPVINLAEGYLQVVRKTVLGFPSEKRNQK